MEHLNVNQGSAAGSFGNLPVETIQEIMVLLEWKSLENFISTSSVFYSVFKGVPNTMLYHLATNEMPAEVLNAALARYACTDLTLKDSIGGVFVESLTHTTDVQLTFSNDAQWILDFTKFHLPIEKFTTEVFLDIMSFHEKIRRNFLEFNAMNLRTASGHPDSAYWISISPSGTNHRVLMALLSSEIVRLFHPETYARHDAGKHIIIRFQDEVRDWILLRPTSDNDPPFKVEFQLAVWWGYIMNQVSLPGASGHVNLIFEH
ncbi:hypothetical protein F5Y11DRAFT_320227 [Daldinia sp. FL1419]|nr:hypothetical protein F5Y11DRAFT_320227 [Daldinia sp. FL1419]